MSQWQIGEVRVTRVVESAESWDGTILLPNATPENLKRESDWLYPTFCDQVGRLRMSIHAFVIDSQGQRIIVDTCVGNDKVRSHPAWNRQQLPFLENLQTVGCPRESIDRVVCTHLHVDHVGWNTMLRDGKWVATFPRATYLMGLLLPHGRRLPEGSGGRFRPSRDGRRDVGAGR